MRLALVIALCAATPAWANDLPFSADADPTTSMPALARALIAADHSIELDPLFRLQLVAGDDAAARKSLTKLLSAHDPAPRIRARNQAYAIYARKGSVDAAFRAVVGALDAKAAAILLTNLSYQSVADAQSAFDADLARHKGATTLASADAVQLVRDYNDLRVATALAPRLAALTDEDDRRRYVVAKDVAIKTPDGATVCALVMRPRGTAKKPTVVEFTIYNDARGVVQNARRAASYDFAGVVGLTRGKGCSSGPIEPYQHDGADADALIEWIAAQPWSDGKVGMYGGSYSGFTPWAAAKHRPSALQAIMVGAPAAPGVDVPFDGNVFWNFIYPWPLFTTTNQTLDDATYGDHARWARLDHDWYTSGRAYRDLVKIDHASNPVWQTWLQHPAYDSFWQSLAPTDDELAHLGIPVLITAGYYYGGPGAATFYMNRYQRAAPKAEAYFVIGPYDHFMAQHGTTAPTTFQGYTLDAAALVDLVEMRFQWFDYTLRGHTKPALLADHVNYEVPGANVWKHAATLDAVAAATRTFYLGAANKLTGTAGKGAVTQTIDFADRKDVDVDVPGGAIEDTHLDTSNGFAFTSEPFATATELSGMFSAELDVVINKRDFDFQVELFEQTAAGHYIQLSSYWARASYVADPSQRHLLDAGVKRALTFHANRMMSRAVAAGSRLVAVVKVLKDRGREINYGTGGVVEDETIADAKIPLNVRWLETSSIAIPIGR